MSRTGNVAGMQVSEAARAYTPWRQYLVSESRGAWPAAAQEALLYTGIELVALYLGQVNLRGGTLSSWLKLSVRIFSVFQVQEVFLREKPERIGTRHLYWTA